MIVPIRDVLTFVRDILKIYYTTITNIDSTKSLSARKERRYGTIKKRQQRTSIKKG